MTYKIKDKNGNYYHIENIQRFSKHIFAFHGKGESLHEENGHYFYVDEEFRKMINQLIKKKNKL